MDKRTAILTYHSQNIAGNETSNNDHVALCADLEAIHRAGAGILSLGDLLDAGSDTDGPELCVALTFDDGCDFDVRDIDYPGHGMQTGFLGIMQDFIARFGADAQAGLHATSFVIASGDARKVIDRKSLFGRGWISDDWWGKNPLISVGNHGWDHHHPDLGPDKGNFTAIETDQECRLQVIRAAQEIERISGAWPAYFAYPFGQSSEYLRRHWFPVNRELHRCRAALGTEPGFVTPDSDRWNLPRFVCGRDWKSPRELIGLLTN